MLRVGMLSLEKPRIAKATWWYVSTVLAGTVQTPKWKLQVRIEELLRCALTKKGQDVVTPNRRYGGYSVWPLFSLSAPL